MIDIVLKALFFSEDVRASETYLAATGGPLALESTEEWCGIERCAAPAPHGGEHQETLYVVPYYGNRYYM